VSIGRGGRQIARLFPAPLLGGVPGRRNPPATGLQPPVLPSKNFDPMSDPTVAVRGRGADTLRRGVDINCYWGG
jgi:hypothetical protein